MSYRNLQSCRLTKPCLPSLWVSLGPAATRSYPSALTRPQPTKILYPTDWMPYKMPEQQALNEKFLSAMEAVLGVQHTKINLAAMWKEFPPAAAEDKPIAEYLENVRMAQPWLPEYMRMC